MGGLAVEKKYWKDVKHAVAKQNKELAEIIEHIAPPDDCYFYECDYCYGAYILNDGLFKLPKKDGSVVSINDTTVPKDIRDDLSYNFRANPAMILLSKVVELYVSINDVIIPSYMVKPGGTFGVSVVVDQVIRPDTYVGGSIWEMTAGVRCCFFLPKVNDISGLNRLQRYSNGPIPSQKTLYDHWSAFRAIIHDSDWRCKVLFFNDKWFEMLHQPGWESLRIYFLQQLRAIQAFWANHFPWNVAFAHIQYSRNIKSNSVALDVVKNIFAVGSGHISGFQPAQNNNFLPADHIEHVYTEIYQIRDYQPVLMHTNTFDKYENRPIYISLQFPTTEAAHEYAEIQSSLKLLEDIRYIYLKHAQYINGTMANLDAPYIHNVVENLGVNFYHTNPRDYEQILPAHLLSHQEDFSRFTECYPGRAFPETSRFFKGCIKISKKQVS